jgi:hypothetical protein
MLDKHYGVFSARLEDKIIDELKNRRQTFKSWNLLFRNLLNLKTPFKLKQKKSKIN